MTNFQHITAQVQHNCTISDSRYAGLYSVCGLALRLRDQYKWEKGLDPWVEKEPSEVLNWNRKAESILPEPPGRLAFQGRHQHPSESLYGRHRPASGL